MLSLRKIHQITTEVYNPEEMAATLLQKYWEAKGHQGRISDLSNYRDILKNASLAIERRVNGIAECAVSLIIALEYEKTTH